MKPSISKKHVGLLHYSPTLSSFLLFYKKEDGLQKLLRCSSLFRRSPPLMSFSTTSNTVTFSVFRLQCVLHNHMGSCVAVGKLKKNSSLQPSKEPFIIILVKCGAFFQLLSDISSAAFGDG